MSLATEFKAFVLRGNVVDLAVGVAIGGAFTNVVKAFSSDIIVPLVGLFGFKSDLKNYAISIHSQKFEVGDLLNNMLVGLITALVIFLLVVKPVNYLMTYGKIDTPTTKECPECLTTVPVGAKRCPACTSTLPDAAGATA